MRPRRIASVLVLVLMVGAICVASLLVFRSESNAAPTVDLTGTWTGDYEFPLGTDEVVRATETLVIERQRGRLVWGVDEYTQDGQLVRIPVRGSVDADGDGFAIAEESGFFLGEIVGPNRVRVRFVRTDDQFTAFEVVLRREK